MPKKDPNVKIVEGCPDWMMTMGDCMSLLLTFFVLLMTFSTPDEDKLMDVIGGIQGALSLIDADADSFSLYKPDEHSSGGDVTDGTAKEVNVGKEQMVPVSLRSLKVVNRFNDFKEQLLKIGFSKFVSTKQLDEGIVMEIPLELVFTTGTIFNPESFRMLEGVANLASSVGNELRITVCFNFETGSYTAGNIADWKLNRQRIFLLGNKLHNKYGIPESQFSYGVKLEQEKPPYIELILLEKAALSQINKQELFKIELEN